MRYARLTFVILSSFATASHAEYGNFNPAMQIPGMTLGGFGNGGSMGAMGSSGIGQSTQAVQYKAHNDVTPPKAANADNAIQQLNQMVDKNSQTIQTSGSFAKDMQGQKSDDASLLGDIQKVGDSISTGYEKSSVKDIEDTAKAMSDKFISAAEKIAKGYQDAADEQRQNLPKVQTVADVARASRAPARAGGGSVMGQVLAGNAGNPAPTRSGADGGVQGPHAMSTGQGFTGAYNVPSLTK